MTAASDLRLLEKRRFRQLHYLGLLLRSELIRGGRERRGFFMRRLVGRISLKLRLYVIPKTVFILYWTVKSRMGASHDRELWAHHRRWLWATTGLSNKLKLRGWADKLDNGRLKILVLGTGSLGDVLQITPVLRALREKAPEAEIVLLHRSLIATKALSGNGHVDSIAPADFYTFGEITKAVRLEGGADLVVEIASVTYLVTYTRAPQARRRPGFDQLFPDAFFDRAEAALRLWAPPSQPPLGPGVKSHWPEKWADQHFLDVLGTTGNLPITRFSRLDFMVDPLAADVMERHDVPQTFITVQSGVDTDVMNWSRATAQYPTKLLPPATWSTLISLLRKEKVAVVQLGSNDDEALPGVHLDLRGQTSLSEAAVLLRRAMCHVGTEGGLVHLSRAVEGRSVVMFGPTSVDFFGYPTNVNLAASDCTSCWRRTRDWYIYCPRGLIQPECMEAHQASTIFTAIMEFVGSGASDVGDTTS